MVNHKRTVLENHCLMTMVTSNDSTTFLTT